MAAAGLWSRTLGVDLTRESANLHGSRRRSVPWQEVQAVVRYGRGGSTGVRLILEHGKPVTLRAPTTMWGLGAAQFDRDFHCIDQWWLAHRGESWRPARVETPPPPVQGGGLDRKSSQLGCALISGHDEAWKQGAIVPREPCPTLRQ